MISEVDRKHLRRDAAHAARNEIDLFLGRYKRRILTSAAGAVKDWATVTNHPADYEADYGTLEGRRLALKAILDFITNAAEEAKAEVREAIASLEPGGTDG